MADSVEEIKSRIDIVDLVKEYLQLSVAGSNFKGRCPFHQEKSASFMVSPAKQIWHCFGCSEGGDLFTFFMKQEGVEFGEALRVLAERAGVKLEQRDPRIQGEKNRLNSLMELAVQYYQQALLRSPKAEVARAYLAKRGFDAAALDEFGIGYALPDFEHLTSFLLSRKYTVAELAQVGLAIKKDQGYGYFDRFRNRIMIPIRNIHGAVIGFGARTLDPAENTGPKYLNSPQTILYDKGRTVFGLDRAKFAIRQDDSAILVEGYMDFFAIYMAGMHNVAATSGTALTVDQVRLIKRFTQHFLFSFDADAAGGQATMRGIEIALKEGVDVRIIQLPKDEKGQSLYKDPDECVKKDLDAWKHAVSHSVSFVEYCFEQTITEEARQNSFDKKKASRKLLDIISLIPDRIEQDHWIKRLGAQLGLTESILWEELKRKSVSASQNTKTTTSDTQEDRVEHIDVFFALLLAQPQLIGKVANVLTVDMIEDSEKQELYRKLLELYAQGGQETGSSLVSMIDAALPAAFIQKYYFLAERDNAATDPLERERTLLNLSKVLAARAVKKTLQILQLRMQQAERSGDSAAMQEATTLFSQLQTHLNQLNP
ncbi:MAG: DNA primase [bacterium]|nr:DNA primase [bacterium]